MVATLSTISSESDSASADDWEAGIARPTIAKLNRTAANLRSTIDALEGRDVNEMSPRQRSEGRASLMQELEV